MVGSTLAVVPSGRADAAGGFLPAGYWVSVTPELGYAPRRIRKYLTNAEIHVVAQMQRMTDALSIGEEEEANVRWFIEPSARRSATFTVQRRVLSMVRRMQGGVNGVMTGWPVDFVIARSQKFIRATLEKLGCSPDLTRSDGQVLMGAAFCNRQVVVSNLTGFLYLVAPGQRITSTMERRVEPSLSQIPYRVVARNTSALAHEWMHAYRAAGLQGEIRSDEPAWFSEGFAEVWSGVAKVKAFRRSVSYRDFHVIRLRDFTNWEETCRQPLRLYRTYASTSNGCEYHVGALAVEYLVARYIPLEVTRMAFRSASKFQSFDAGFQWLTGRSVAEFEREADRYINTIRKAALAG